jgi:hypothetical protein
LRPAGMPHYCTCPSQHAASNPLQYYAVLQLDHDHATCADAASERHAFTWMPVAPIAHSIASVCLPAALAGIVLGCRSIAAPHRAQQVPQEGGQACAQPRVTTPGRGHQPCDGQACTGPLVSTCVSLMPLMCNWADYRLFCAVLRGLKHRGCSSMLAGTSTFMHLHHACPALSEIFKAFTGLVQK